MTIERELAGARAEIDRFATRAHRPISSPAKSVLEMADGGTTTLT